MINPSMIRFLNKCIETGYSHNMVINYITNATIIPHGIEKLWREFKHIQLVLSLDGYGEMNSYIRYPSNWEIINFNLKKLDRYHEIYNIEVMTINTVVQVYNVFYLDELMEYITGEFEFLNPVPDLSALDFPNYLSCKILPLEMKEEAKKYLIQTRDKYIEKIPERYHFSLSIFDYFIEHMYSEQNDNLIPTFIDITERWDKLRKQDILKIAPKLKDLMNYNKNPL